MEALIPWLPFIGLLIVEIIRWLVGRRKQAAEIRTSDSGIQKNSADIIAQIVTGTNYLIEPLNRQIGSQNKRIEILEATVLAQDTELARLRPLPDLIEEQKLELQALRSLPKNMAKLLRGVNILITQLRRLGHEPEWTPEAPPA